MNNIFINLPKHEQVIVLSSVNSMLKMLSSPIFCDVAAYTADDAPQEWLLTASRQMSEFIDYLLEGNTDNEPT